MSAVVADDARLFEVAVVGRPTGLRQPDFSGAARSEGRPAPAAAAGGGCGGYGGGGMGRVGAAWCAV